MTKEEKELDNELRRDFVNQCNSKYGGVLNAVGHMESDLDNNLASKYKNATKAAARFADENGKVDPRIQGIMARIHGLI